MKRSQTLALAAAVAIPGAAAASETATYSYDALGRLTAVTTSGGPNAGLAVSTGYDPAGNRSSYAVSGATPTATAAPLSAADAQALFAGETSAIEDDPLSPAGASDEPEPEGEAPSAPEVPQAEAPERDQ
ncbi:MAG TPA: RHS repeat domain-containing protein [Propylenella sp.]|nr:RHS repeat domain-containing protein [Propylenella sp.]